MSAARPAAPKRRVPWVRLSAAVLAVAAVTTGAIVAEGYEAQELPRLESAVWVARDAGQYARVNTELGELDTVRQVEDPAGVAQSGATSVVFTQGNRRWWPVDPAAPADLVADSDAGDGEASAASAVKPESTPTGTRQVVVSGARIAYLTDTGSVFIAELGDDGVSAPMPVDPYAVAAPSSGPASGAEAAYRADAVAIDPDGRLAMYSAEEGAVRRFDARTGEFRGDATPVPEAPSGEELALELALVDGRWALSQPERGRLWLEGAGAVETGRAADARLQASTSTGERLLLADSEGLVAVDLDDGAITELAEAAGVPAAPAEVGGVVYAAWLSPTSATLWSSDAEGTRPLDADHDTLAEVQAATPEIRGNGTRAVLSERSTGLVWTLPEGRLIPLSQWSQDDDTEEEAGTVEVEDVAEQHPPVAHDDRFGVRPGALVKLPLLLNDSDPNKKDVLSIAADALGPLSDPGFGAVGLVADDQQAVVRVQAGEGSATFEYAVSDGAARSAPAKVTLDVVPDDRNTAPEWCGVEGCVAPWPAPQLAPGGTATVSVLPGWVDPEGDPIVLADARAVDADAPIVVIPTADGRVALRHTDPNAGDETIAVRLVVADDRGARSEATLKVAVTASPALVAHPAVLVAGAGETRGFDLAEHVTGGSGSYRLLDAAPNSPVPGLTVAPNPSSGTVELAAAEPGEYTIVYDVQDAITQAEQSAVLRLTVVGADAALAVPPLTAFVRANEDTTVEVLDAVRNPGGQVLSITGAASSDPALDVDVIDRSRLRVSGSTPSGEPGRVGTVSYTVADGSGAAVEGALTVFLVAASAGQAPIAVADAVTARAGTAVDIPVLDNDVSPRGERLELHPDVEGSGTDGELAFASGRTLRYLAPETPGVYTLRYSAALENAPDRLASTQVRVTVTPAGQNRPPQPPTLAARVAAGESVVIPVPQSGADPDGDRIVVHDVTQPEPGQGVAAVGADGASLVYTAPGLGVSGGQLAFDYSVHDGHGETVAGRVRVAVLPPGLVDAAPVAFSDYVRIARGSATAVVVEPLQNDRDPAGGALELLGIEPNAPEGTPEHARLSALIDDGTELDEGRVALRAGDVGGPASFIYTVRSTATSSTAQGLVIMQVTESSAPDRPVVADTVVTAANRDELGEAGIDVVTGKVRWASGDPAALRLSVWGPAASDYRVSGSRIAGPAPEDGALVPFELRGEDADGEAIRAYGFLRIPAFDDLRLQLRAGFDPLQVDEEQSLAFTLAEVLDVPDAGSVELRGDDAFTVQRQNARCAPEGSGARYATGREAPWRDSCLVPVRLAGQEVWSMVAVPVAIRPKDPLAILTPVSRTVAPGASESIELYDSMTSWEGDRVGDEALLDYAASYSGSAFTVTQTGRTVTAEAHADSKPGTSETVRIDVSAFGGLSSTVTLVVGVAPQDAPRGATFQSTCEVSAGPSCTVPVVGVSGEYDPFAGKEGSGLKLVSVDAGGSRCDVASVSASGDTGITAVWPNGPTPAGGECVVPFTVADAQGRTGTGRLTIDVRGYPAKPESVSTVGYDGGSVALDVALGEASLAHPDVTGVTIHEAGRPVAAACAPARAGVYRCTVGGLANGEQHEFTARAVNDIGASLDTSPVRTWAYQAPVVKDVTATPVYEAGRTDRSTAVVDVVISSSRDARSFRVAETGQQIQREGDTTRVRLTTHPGAQQITIVPSSQFAPPVGDAGVDGAGVATQVTAAGSPVFDGGIAAAPVPDSNTSISITGGRVDPNGAPGVTSLVYVAWLDGEVSCRVDGSGGLVVSGGVQSTSPTIGGLAEYEEYRVKACASNGFGIVESNTTKVVTFSNVDAPDGTTSYTIAATPRASGGDEWWRYDYELASGPRLDTERRFHPEYNVYGEWRRDFSLTPDAAPGNARARACHDWRAWECSGEIALDWINAPTTAWVEIAPRFEVPWEGSPRCVAEPTTNDLRVSGAAAGAARVSVDRSADGLTATYTLTWTGAFVALDDLAQTVPLCQPEPEPEPEEPPDDGEEDPPPPGDTDPPTP